MAVSKKSDFHTAPQNYQDVDGMKTFTVIDHDIKSKVSAYKSPSEKEMEEIKKWMANNLKERIEETLQFPAASVAGVAPYETLIIRTPEGFKWDEKAVKEHLTTNRNSFLPMTVWKRTVTMSNWHHPMWIEGDHEAIMGGDWKELM